MAILSRGYGSSRAILLACGRVPCGSVPNWIVCIIANFIVISLLARVKRKLGGGDRIRTDMPSRCAGFRDQ